MDADSDALTEWSCLVREGQTTGVEILIPSGSKCALRGSFLVDGRAPSDWRAVLRPTDTRKTIAQCNIDMSGFFDLYVEEPGHYRLIITSPDSIIAVSDTVELAPGTAYWTHDLVTSRVEIRNIPWQKVQLAQLSYEWSGVGDLLVRIWRGERVGEAVVFPMVPAGDGAVKLATRLGHGSGGSTVDGSGDLVMVHVHVEPGEEKIVFLK